ncbi:MAG: hypothetical protein IPL32_05500 [Chloracidobacterium sp.]|nr:hypothetical protein [Chloracidobacterium sp.]
MSNSNKNKAEPIENARPLVEEVDFYFEDGLMVLTRHYLLKRGYCCENRCRHCPYETSADIES